MTTWAHIPLRPPLDEWAGAPGALFPVREDGAKQLQASRDPQPEQLLFELEHYLAEHPRNQERLSAAGGQLAFRTAVELFTNGLKEESLQFYELSLRLRPDDVITRVNYAVALHALQYRDAALAEYERVMAVTSPGDQLRVWVLAAQIHFLRERYADVVRLLEPLAAQHYPQDAEFWHLLGSTRAAGKEREPAVLAPSASAAPPVVAPVVAPPPVASGRRCGACSASLKPTAKFCPACGTPAPVPVAAADTCGHCGAPRRPGAKFCRSCGKA